MGENNAEKWWTKKVMGRKKQKTTARLVYKEGYSTTNKTIRPTASDVHGAMVALVLLAREALNLDEGLPGHRRPRPL